MYFSNFVDMVKQILLIYFKLYSFKAYIFRLYCAKQHNGMETKNGKQFLPQTYQSFVALKKKVTKTPSHVGRSISISQNNLLAQFQQIPRQLKKASQIKSAEDDQDQTNTSSKIVEKTVYSDYQKMFDQFQNCKFQAISDKIKKQIQRLRQQTPARVVSINGILKDLSVQSLQNLRNLQRELKVGAGRRNIQKIDSMLSFNKFFVILNKEKRSKIYDHCEFLIVQEGQQIYKQGEVQDFMYVVVKGCIKQYEKKSTSYHQKITVNFISHYQGSNFGQAQLVGQKNQKAKRHHTAIASQESFLLKIDNQFYRDLITNSAEDDFEKKISSLLSTSIFGDTSKIFVTPLLSTLEKKTLNFGQVLIRQGDPVRKLYFIGEGNLQIVYVLRDKRSVKHLNIEQKPKNFYIKGNTSKKKQREKNHSIHHTFYYSKQQLDNKKQFVYGKKKIVGEQLQYNDQIVFQELRNGNFLGGKSFLSGEDLIKKSKQSQYFDEQLQAKLTVVGSSLFTTIYSLDQKKFFSLSDNLQKVITNGIMKSTYFDERDINTKITSHQEWKKYSQNLVAKVIKEKKSRNQSFRN